MKPKNRAMAITSKRTDIDKKKLFVEAYLSNGGNATKAAIAAGYEKSGASKQGYRMSKNPEIVSMLDKRRTSILETLERNRLERIASLELDTEMSLRETARIAYSDPRKIMNSEGKILMPHELDEDTAAAVASFEISFDGGIKYRFWPKTTALDQAHKIQGHYDKDNKQKADPLRALLDGLSGNVLGVKRDQDDNEETEHV